MVATVLTIINGCQKDEHVLIDEQLQNEVKPDVYVENGYLAFKNMEAVDSIIQMLGKMTFQEVEAWENKLGFKSAKTYFEPIFREAEQANTIEDIVAFKEKHLNVLKWYEEDVTDYSFDYPFYYTNFVSLINKEGIMKIGKSLFIYTKENRFTILDGDILKLHAALKTVNETDNIKILGKRNNLKGAVIGLTNFDGQYGDDGNSTDDWCNYTSTRRMKTGLQFQDFVYQNASGNYDGNYKIYLWQRAQHKTLGVWVNYSVNYRVGNVVYKEYNALIYADPGYQTSPSTQSTTWTMYNSPAVFINQATPPPIPIPSPMYFSCYTTNSDFNYYQYNVVYDN